MSYHTEINLQIANLVKRELKCPSQQQLAQKRREYFEEIWRAMNIFMKDEVFMNSMHVQRTQAMRQFYPKYYELTPTI
jgi:hypothetical protein